MSAYPQAVAPPPPPLPPPPEIIVKVVEEVKVVEKVNPEKIFLLGPRYAKHVLRKHFSR